MKFDILYYWCITFLVYQHSTKLSLFFPVKTWIQIIVEQQEYFNVLHAAFDHNLGIAILRVHGGLDFSEHVTAEEIVAGDADEEADRKPTFKYS